MAASDEHLDVAIVGGGPVGAILAAVLADEGLRVVVLERETPPTQAKEGVSGFDGRAIALAEGGRRLLDGWGLWAELAPRAEPIEHIHVNLRGAFGTTRLSAAEEGVAALGQVLDSASMAPILLSAAQKRGVDWRAPAWYVAHEVSTDGVRVRYATTEGEEELSARLLVAADGAGSAVRTALFGELAGQDYDQVAILARVEVENPMPRTAFERFTDEGPIALLPMGGTRYSLVWVTRQRDVDGRMALDDVEFLQQLGQRFGQRLGRFTWLGARSAYPLRATTASQITAPRMVILGNAAHALHPVAGQGLNLCLRDIRALLGELAQAWQEGRDLGSDAVLQAYAKARASDYAKSYPLMDVLARGFTDDVPLPRTLKGLALSALDACPPLRRRFARQMMGLNG